MKKILTTLCLCTMLLISGIFITACGEKSETKNYTITLPTSTDYTITSDKEFAEEGQTINLTITLTNNEIVIENVLANNNTCNRMDNSTYSFIMPDENVTITVQTSHLQEVFATDFVWFDEDNLYTITQSGSGTYSNTRDLNITFAKKQGMTSVRTTFSSSNQFVIPNSAISFDPVTDSDLNGSSGSNQILKGIIEIDPTQINEGTSYLTMEFASNNNSSSIDRGTLIVKITVVPYGELTLETVKETLVIDLFSEMQYQTGDKFCLRIGDRDHVDGSSNPSYVDYILTLQSGRRLSIEFDYILGHRFWIRLVEGESQPDVQPGYIEEFIFDGRSIEGDEESGYTGFLNDSLMYLNANDSVTIDAERNPAL